jgi:heme oxygenase
MTLSEQLKISTKSLHDAAEGQNFQRLLANGLLSVDMYAMYLAQLFLVHKTLEEAIANYASTDARLAQVVSSDQIQEQFLKEDLDFLGTSPQTIQPLPATARLLETIGSSAKNNPVSLLGFHYVLLGSKHGGKLIARNLKERYRFDGSGTKYFNPYGESFMPCWQAFIKNLNGIPLAGSDGEEIVAAAQAMFRAVSQIGQQLESQIGQKPKH